MSHEEENVIVIILKHPTLIEENAEQLLQVKFKQEVLEKIKNEGLKIKEVQLYNVLGECIRNQQLTTNNEQLIKVDVSDLTSGMYFIEAKTENGILRTKFVKQ